MRCCKRPITAFMLLLLLAVPLLFSVVILVKQQIAQHQRNEKFSKEILQTVTVSSSEIYWVKREKEILLNGKLFDVKSYSKNGNSISLTGFFDHKEDKLVQQIVRLALQKDHTGNPLSEPAIKFLFFPAYATQHETSSEICWQFISQQYHRFIEMIPIAPDRLPTHPPC